MKNNYLKCQYCGKSDETVQETLDPYVLELYNDEVSIIVCEDCYGDRMEEI